MGGAACVHVCAGMLTPIALPGCALLWQLFLMPVRHHTCPVLCPVSTVHPPVAHAASGIAFNYHLFGNAQSTRPPLVMIMGLGTTQYGWSLEVGRVARATGKRGWPAVVVSRGAPWLRR